MSAQRFIRCKHCGMPHEGEAVRCPVTGGELVPPRPRRSAPAPPDVAEPYRWVHGLAPRSGASDAEGEPMRDPRSLVGRWIEGKYRIDALIGQGGMGAVYRAENTRIGKPVAIKILLAGHARDSDAERRFLREARIAGSIGHPNICQVFDLGVLEDGSPFQVMELLEGQTLASRIRIEGALAIDEALDVAEQVLGALSAAHERGIVHRDLKPDNVFLHLPGHHEKRTAVAKLLDFGVSKSLLGEQTLSLTRTGVVVGTPYYLAPEQARGHRGVDHRVDIWAMGVLLYEAVTGTRPFRADDYDALLTKILQARPVPMAQLRPRVPTAITEIVERAMAFEPHERFASADAMLGALRAARGRPPVCSDRAFRGLPEVPPLVPARASEATMPDVRISVVQGPDDATEISDGFALSELDWSKSRS